MKEKRLFTFAVMLMLGLSSLMAQIDGKWKADKHFKEEMEIDENMDLVLEFREQIFADFSIIISGNIDGIIMSMKSTIPGTYTRKGNDVKIYWEETKFYSEIIDLRATTPETQKFLNDPEMRKAIYGFAKERTFKPEHVKTFTNVLSNFTIKSITNDAMVIDIPDFMEITFLREK